MHRLVAIISVQVVEVRVLEARVRLEAVLNRRFRDQVRLSNSLKVGHKAPVDSSNSAVESFQ